MRSELAPEPGPVVGTVARLSHEKAVDVLLESFPCVLERVPSATALIVGDGPAPENLRQLAALLRDDTRREALGSNARAKVRRWFTRERMVRETHALYMHALAD